MPESRALAPISVVIPTYDRGALLEATLRRCRACAGPVELEFVVIDDGSRDDTPARLEALAAEIPGLVWRSVENGGPGRARNLGASLAKHDVVLFLGDDIQPVDDAFFRVHAELHARHPELEFAVLGKVVWPDRRELDVNPVMAHVQGPGGEQFGYADLEPYTFLDWRFFYTANVSVKRGLVDDWPGEGFSSAFPLAAYEDAEFAYRMMQRDPPLRLFYTPASLGTHHHPFSADAFMARQVAAGMMAAVFADLHPNAHVRNMIGLGGVAHALAQPHSENADAHLADFVSMVEGVKSWLRLLDTQRQLGTQWWHDQLLHAVFGLCYLQGYLMAQSDPAANLAAGYYFALDGFSRAMSRTVQTELTGRALGRDVERLFTVRGEPSVAVAQSRLRAWARQRPGLVRAVRWWRRRRHG